MKIAIVDKQSNVAVFSYESHCIQQRTNMFGGPWDDPNQFEHAKIPVDLENEPLSNLEAYNGEEQNGTQMVQSGTKPAFDSNNQPILGPDGQQTTVPVYVSQPIMIPKRLMRRK